MIFNHVAIFPEKLWPRQIVTNGHVLMEGAKMSKSLGNIIPLKEGLAKFGADPIRLGVLTTAELLQDADFSSSTAKSMREKLERLHKFTKEFTKTKTPKKAPQKLLAIDKWMLSRLQEHIRKATEAMDKLAVRKAIHSIIYELDQDFLWYQRRIKDQNKKANRKNVILYIFNEVLDAQIRMLSPFAPHICEELWEIKGGKNFVSQSIWPTPNQSKIDIKAEENEALIANMLEDTLNIIKATGIKPKKIFYYFAASWKWKVYQKALEKSVSAKIVQGDLIREVLKEADLGEKAREIATFVNKIVQEINRMPDEKKQRLLKVGFINESQMLKEAEDFFKRELKADIHFYNEEDIKLYDQKNKAVVSAPYRPAIYIE